MAISDGGKIQAKLEEIVARLPRYCMVDSKPLHRIMYQVQVAIMNITNLKPSLAASGSQAARLPELRRKAVAALRAVMDTELAEMDEIQIGDDSPAAAGTMAKLADLSIAELVELIEEARQVAKEKKSDLQTARGGGCTCFQSAPCSFCMDGGNLEIP